MSVKASEAAFLGNNLDETTSAAVETETATVSETVSPLSTAAAKEREARRKSFFNAEQGVLEVTHPDNTVQKFDISLIPDAVLLQMQFLGIWTFIRSSDDLAGNFDKLVKGELPETAEKTEKLSPWKLAAAHALVDETKDTENPMTLEQAIPFVRNMDRKAIEIARKNPAVVHFHGQLTKKPDAPEVSLLATLTPTVVPAAEAATPAA